MAHHISAVQFIMTNIGGENIIDRIRGIRGEMGHFFEEVLISSQRAMPQLRSFGQALETNLHGTRRT